MQCLNFIPKGESVEILREGLPLKESMPFLKLVLLLLQWGKITVLAPTRLDEHVLSFHFLTLLFLSNRFFGHHIMAQEVTQPSTGCFQPLCCHVTSLQFLVEHFLRGHYFIKLCLLTPNHMCSHNRQGCQHENGSQAVQHPVIN